jgi:hypothetical protein
VIAAKTYPALIAILRAYNRHNPRRDTMDIHTNRQAPPRCG